MKQPMTVKQLKKAIEDWPEDDPVILRCVELDEVQLTVELTSVDCYETENALLLVGEIPRATTTHRGHS